MGIILASRCNVPKLQDVVSGMLVADEAGVGTGTVVVGGLEAEAGEAGAEAGGQGAGRAGDRKEAGAGRVVVRGAGPRARRKR